MSLLDWFARRPAPAPEPQPEPAPAPDVFEDAFARVIGEEGGFTDDPADPGGRTKYGISQRAYPALDIAALTLDQARDIYRRDYWDAHRLDELPPRIAIALFDGIVNSGPRAAVAWLQRAVQAPDGGVMDDHTIALARAATDPSGVLMRYWGNRLKFLADLASWPAFSRGWARRVARGLQS